MVDQLNTKEKMKMDYIPMIVQILTGMIAAAIFTALVYYGSRPSNVTEVNWITFGAYEIVGIGLGAYAAYSGMGITPEWIATEILFYNAIILIIDQALSGLFKHPVQMFVLKR